jgi:hypothetical protein
MIRGGRGRGRRRFAKRGVFAERIELYADERVFGLNVGKDLRRL